MSINVNVSVSFVTEWGVEIRLLGAEDGFHLQMMPVHEPNQPVDVEIALGGVKDIDHLCQALEAVKNAWEEASEIE